MWVIITTKGKKLIVKAKDLIEVVTKYPEALYAKQIS